MRRVDQGCHSDGIFSCPIARAAAIIGLIAITGCGPAGVGSVDFAQPPDVSKIGVPRKAEPTPDSHKQPDHPPSRKAPGFIPG